MLFCHAERRLVVHAPAKLNLFLEIHRRRDDGFHEIESVLVSVGLYDSLAFADRPSADDDSEAVRLRCRRADSSGVDDCPTGAENLVVRAAELLRRHAGMRRGVGIELIKRIPVAAGLAGGSSDAAATLAGLNRWWKLRLSAAELQRLAGELGSDVPFFLAPSPLAVARGRGEQLEPLRLPAEWHFVVVRPSQGLSTAEVYRHCRPAESLRRAAPLIDALRHGRIGSVGRQLHNALQAPAEALNDQVGQLRSALAQLGLPGHQMSGSGSAYFGLCANRRQARSVAARLRAAGAGRVFTVQSRL
ncbi:MAG: 4-(cytidine 5'-diphospho)-2-C-methyl-D-erythritol kinase [Planctomycetaceae bacterium]